jgi:hypothetical protein
MTAKWKYDSKHPGRRCRHAYCSECKTRRGSNLGNRRVRHAISLLLRTKGDLV